MTRGRSAPENANLVFLYLAPMVVLPGLALHFFVDHKQGMRDVGRLPALKQPAEVQVVVTGQ